MKSYNVSLLLRSYQYITAVWQGSQPLQIIEFECPHTHHSQGAQPALSPQLQKENYAHY